MFGGKVWKRVKAQKFREEQRQATRIYYERKRLLCDKCPLRKLTLDEIKEHYDEIKEFCNEIQRRISVEKTVESYGEINDGNIKNKE